MMRMLSFNSRVGLCAEMAYQNGPGWETTRAQENCDLRWLMSSRRKERNANYLPDCAIWVPGMRIQR